MLTVGGLIGCSGSLRPLYRDFEVTQVEGDVYERIESALNAANWVQVEPNAPNVVATEARTFSNWGLYKIKVSLEILPMNEHYVRVMVHPYRHYFTGGRSKLSFLSSGLHNKVLGQLNEALAEQGFHMLGRPIEKDKELTNVLSRQESI
jgi:hypothetical protein